MSYHEKEWGSKMAAEISGKTYKKIQENPMYLTDAKKEVMNH